MGRRKSTTAGTVDSSGKACGALQGAEGWWEKYRIFIGTRQDGPANVTYGQLLASSVFCLVAPGDGWSSRAEDAVLHGCIPVVIMDDVDPVFASVLDWPYFSVRIAENEIHRTAEILLAIPQEQIKRMQEELAKVWHRFLWGSLPASHTFEQGSQTAEQVDDPDAEEERLHESLLAPIVTNPAEIHVGTAGEIDDDLDDDEEGEDENTQDQDEQAIAAEQVELQQLVSQSNRGEIKPHWVPHYSDTSDDALDTLLAWLYKKALVRETQLEAPSNA
eukprot:jgi/Botrbrau1/8277/Bobra.0251s0006.1